MISEYNSTEREIHRRVHGPSFRAGFEFDKARRTMSVINVGVLTKQFSPIATPHLRSGSYSLHLVRAFTVDIYSANSRFTTDVLFKVDRTTVEMTPLCCERGFLRPSVCRISFHGRQGKRKRVGRGKTAMSKERFISTGKAAADRRVIANVFLLHDRHCSLHHSTAS
jgi:hypothetical protein